MTEITICSGTLCYIMGGADIFEIETKLSEMYNDKIRIKASTCLGFCEGENKQNPPCVMVGNELIPDATIEKIINHLKRLYTR
ncbi:MAG: NAD(P)H-dependent oxidoreductase subunit E [Bacteroidales bacterium]|nr:NAD(P)H-dependent oxidoreductase subunit E [Bacteroidales bacterium]